MFSKLLSGLFSAMVCIAVVYLNIRAIEKSKPVLARWRDKVKSNKFYQKTKKRASEAGGTVTNIFTRKEQPVE